MSILMSVNSKSDAPVGTFTTHRFAAGLIEPRLTSAYTSVTLEAPPRTGDPTLSITCNETMFKYQRFDS